MTIPNAENNKKNGIGPDIWLAGDPEDLKDWMDKGVKGIVTNTVVLKDILILQTKKLLLKSMVTLQVNF